MKTHISLVLLLTFILASCASHEGRSLSSIKERDAQAQHDAWVGTQADRFR